MRLKIVDPTHLAGAALTFVLGVFLFVSASPIEENLGVFVPLFAASVLGVFFGSAGTVVCIGDSCRLGDFWRHRVTTEDVRRLQVVATEQGASLVLDEHSVWNRRSLGMFSSQEGVEDKVRICLLTIQELIGSER